jgi:integrase
MRIIETRITVAAKPTASTPKTNAGRRSIPLDIGLVDELRAHKARQAEELLAIGRVLVPRDFIFTDKLGEPYRPEHFSWEFAKATKKAGLRVIRLHDRRHTAASLMLAAGEAPKVVAEILGHASTTITVEIYQHLMPGMSEAAGERLTGLLSRPGQSAG